MADAPSGCISPASAGDRNFCEPGANFENPLHRRLRHPRARPLLSIPPSHLPMPSATKSSAVPTAVAPREQPPNTPTKAVAAPAHAQSPNGAAVARTGAKRGNRGGKKKKKTEKSVSDTNAVVTPSEAQTTGTTVAEPATRKKANGKKQKEKKEKLSEQQTGDSTEVAVVPKQQKASTLPQWKLGRFVGGRYSHLDAVYSKDER